MGFIPGGEQIESTCPHWPVVSCPACPFGPQTDLPTSDHQCHAAQRSSPDFCLPGEQRQRHPGGHRGPGGECTSA